METSILVRLSLMLLTTIWITGCATNRMTSTERTEAYNQYIENENLEQLKQITAFKFDSWGSLGQEHLIISTKFNKPYLITLKTRCFDLRTAMVIGIDNMGSTLRSKFDSILVPDNSGQKCYIKSIYKLTKEQKKALLKIGPADYKEKGTG